VARLTPPRSLLLRFSALSLLCFIALGVGLKVLLEREIEDRVVAHDAEAATYLADLLGGELARGRFDFPATGSARAVAARFLRYDHHGPEYKAVRVWDAGLRLVIGRSRAGDHSPSARRRRAAALDGGLVAERRVTRLHYLVPLRATPGGAPVGVLEVIQRSAPLETKPASPS